MDDVADVRWLLEKALERLGCAVDVAEHGEQALVLFENAQAQGRPYQAVILDLTIVDGMGGLETMRRIRAIDPEVRGIVSSGYSNDPVLANPEQYGFDARLEKPFTSDVVAELLADVLAQVRVPGPPHGKELAMVYQQLQTRKGLD
jgi:CheY-like chemotaxis protein